MEKSLEPVEWIVGCLQPQAVNSERFFYDAMESQSEYWLPLIYQPFDAANPGHWYDRGSMFDFLSATHGEGARLLDFGPGDGWPSLIVAPYAGEVVGVDGSHKRVEVCTQNAARMGIGNARFEYVAPGQPLPFADNTFDGGMAASSIEQTPDPRATLRELYRVLRPGGRLRVTFESLGIYRGGLERAADLWARSGKACWLTLYDRDIDGEQARMYRVVFNLSVAETTRALGWDEQQPLWDSLSAAKLEALRPVICEALTCTLTHPNGATLTRWMREIGFSQALPTHSGSWFAGELYKRLPESQRPTDLSGVDALLKPLVPIVVEMQAPASSEHGHDAPITAVK